MRNEIIARLRAITAMPRAEIVSRHNAIDEIKRAAEDAIRLLESERTTSDEVASLAAEYLGMERTQIGVRMVNESSRVVDDIQTMAGSLMAQADGPEDKSLPLLESVEGRALADAITHGQAKPFTETVVVGDGSTGLNPPEEDKPDA